MDLSLSNLFAFLIGVMLLPCLKILRHQFPLTRGSTWHTKERRQMLIKDGEL